MLGEEEEDKVNKEMKNVSLWVWKKWKWREKTNEWEIAK